MKRMSFRFRKFRCRPTTNAPAYWIFLPGLVTFILFLALANPLATGYRLIVGLSAFSQTPALFGLIFRILKKQKAALWCSAIVVGLYWACTFFLFFHYARQTLIGLIYMWMVFIPVAFISVATSISLARSVGSEWALGSVGMGFFCGLVAISALQASKESEYAWPRPLDPSVLAPDIITISKCSQDFAKSHPDVGYPDSLEKVGPRGTGCLSQALMAGQDKGFTIMYKAGANNGTGRTAGYTIRAQETSPKGQDFGSILTDESGVIRIRYDGPHGKGSTSLYFPQQAQFEQVLHCLENVTRTPGPWVIYSDASKAVFADPYDFVRRWLGDRSFTDIGKFSPGGYEYEYNFVLNPDKMIHGFTLDARPRRYGFVGIRSYLAIATTDGPTGRKHLNVYATPQDRAATTNDPLAEAAEIGLFGVHRATTDYE